MNTLSILRIISISIANRDPYRRINRHALKAVYGVENVNALKSGERLTFDKTGLTVVYGDNGSGKSGYARILKQVCRARVPSSGDTIQPNIYAMETGKPKAVINYSVNGHKKKEVWQADNLGNALLSSVSVFDSKTANVHVDAVNDVAYTPFPMRVLERLADACHEVKTRIKTEILVLNQHTSATIAAPACCADTAVGIVIAGLSGDTTEQTVRELAKLDATEQRQLVTLRTNFAIDPLKATRQMEAQKNRLDNVNTTVKALQKAVSQSQVTQLSHLSQAYNVAKVAAKVAADSRFADDPLQKIGSDAWRVLWEGARAYSEHEAYPDLLFPVTEDGAHCVLCQQKLDASTANRLERFEDFIRDETKQKEEQAAEKYQAALKELTDAEISAVDTLALVAFIRDELNDDKLATSVRRAIVTLKWRQRAILRNPPIGNRTIPLPVAAPWPFEAIRAHTDSLSERITALRAEDNSEERIAMRAEFEELADREWLAVIQEDVIVEISRQKRREELNAVLRDTATNRISTKSGEIAEQLVTNVLRAQFSREMGNFDVAGLAIELRREKTSYGVPQFRVSLIRKPDVRVGKILSEGEHRCVALAAFLAELATTESHSTIVFDDPVSSLDHLHRDAVAERLAVEALRRQVIVLTHDIAFLFLLDKACRDKGTHLAFRSVTRTDEYAGFIQQDPPARAQSVEKVVESMQKHLDKRRILYESGDHEEWERTVDALQKRLRFTWERAVEEAVGPVIKRLSNKVETRGLAKVTTITFDDCIEMRKAYGRCSTLLHSSADALNPPLPKPETVQDEITSLQNWISSVKNRQDDIDWLL